MSVAVPELRVAVIVALGLEHAALRTQLPAAAGSGVNVLQSGPGAERAERAATAALAAGADALVSFGLAGGLDSRLAAGAILVPRRVRTDSGEVLAADAAWQAAALDALARDSAVSEGDLLCTRAALLTPAAKSAAAAAHGAAAVDMESAAIAASAARAGARFIALRVIVDTAMDSLPASAESWIDARGNRRIGAALAAAVQPAQWRTLWILAGRYRAARRSLDRLAALAAASRFFAAPGLAGRSA